MQLDLSLAFDTLDTSTLLWRLRFSHAISGPSLNWVSSYLVCRSQSVRVGQKQSQSIACEYGVPQWSVLGPLLFSLYVSLLAKVISSSEINQTQHADDTQLYIALNDVNSIPQLSVCFRAVQHWLDLYSLSMNPDKTEAVVIGTGARQRMEDPVNAVDLGCSSVSPASSVRSLGVTVDNTLSFKEYVDNVCKSCTFHILALRHIRRHISEDAAETIACSMIGGRLDCCSSVLHRTSVSTYDVR
jgi:hypothetical protein